MNTKTILLLSIFFFFSINIFSQYDVSYKSPDGQYIFKGKCKNRTKPYEKFGKWIGYDNSGRKVVEFHLKNKLKTGLFKSYHLTGEVAMEGELDRSSKIGVWKEYDMWGKLLKKYECTRDLTSIENTIEEYYSIKLAQYLNGYYETRSFEGTSGFNFLAEEDDWVKQVGRYKNGVRDGTFNYYDEKGRVVEKKQYNDSKLVTSIKFYSNPSLNFKKEEKLYGEFGDVKFHVKRNKKGNVTFLSSKPDYTGINGYYEIYNQENVLTERRCYKEGKFSAISSESACLGRNSTETINSSTSSATKENTDTKIGYRRQYHSSGNLKYKARTVNGVRNGPATWYFSDGKTVEQELTHVKGRKEGKLTGYYKSGEVEFEFIYQNGTKNGPARWYYENGNLEKSGTYSNGKLEGKFTWFYKDSEKVMQESVYKNGKREGQEIGYYKNGKTKFKKNYVNGIKNGLHIRYNEDGIITEKNNYKNDKLDGESFVYYETGELANTAFFKAGKKQGNWIIYHKNGKVKGNNIFNDKGERHGTEIWYYSNGAVRHIKTYDNDKLLNVVVSSDRDGKPNDKGTLKDGNGTHIQYKDDGVTVKEVLLYKDGILVKK